MVRSVLPALVGLFLTACAVQLAPGYDPSLVAGIDSANEEAMSLFASVSSGVSAATFGRREDHYNTVIGKLEALRISAASRPAASGSLFLRQATAGEIPTLESPTPDILNDARKPIETMRDTDRSRGLTPNLVEGFKRSFEIRMQQALVYEKALRR
jgi:hypothetical protein